MKGGRPGVRDWSVLPGDGALPLLLRLAIASAAIAHADVPFGVRPPDSCPVDLAASSVADGGTAERVSGEVCLGLG